MTPQTIGRIRRRIISNKIKYSGIEPGKTYGGMKVLSVEPGADEHSPLIVRYAPENVPSENTDAIRQCADYYFREHFKNKKS